MLRTIVNQPTATERVTLMHHLVSMSDDDRDRLLDEFWDEVTDGLVVHPAYVEQLHRLRPDLPADPTTEQLQAWIELADLVQDDAFRHEVRRYFHDAFSSPLSVEMTAPWRLDRAEESRRIQVEVWEAQRSGLSPDSPRAREIAERLVVSMAELLADAPGAQPSESDLDELRRSIAAPDPTSAAHQHADRAVSGFNDLLDTFTSLLATINPPPHPDPEEPAGSEEWLAAALAPAASHDDPAPGR